MLSITSFSFAETYQVTKQEREEFKRGMKLALYRENGETIGYLVKDVHSGSIADKIGIMPKDMIVATNGYYVSNMETSSKMREAFDRLESLTLTVVRPPTKAHQFFNVNFKIVESNDPNNASNPTP